MALLPAASRIQRRRDSRVGPGAAEHGAHLGEGGAPARGDAGAAAPAAPHSQARCPSGARHPPPAAITVGAGVTEAAALHLRSLVARLRLANQELHQAARKLDELCTALSETYRVPRTADLATRRSFVRCLGSARSRSPPCSPRPPGRSRVEITRPSGPSRAWHPLPSAVARAASSSCAMPPRSDCETLCFTGRG